MCTVTYFPIGKNDFILTSNRDETPLRKTIPPKKYDEKGVELVYPKDEIAGGTWIGTSNKNRLVCLLNGGYENHIRKLPYKMSRGIIVKNILSAADGVSYINEFDFDNIEPFTLVLIDWNDSLLAYELVWDGIQKHFKKLSKEPRIWSSSTLYTKEMRTSRKKWFDDFLNANNEYNQDEILKFHQNEKLGTPETSIKMKRDFVETVSITSIIKNDLEIKIDYLDFVSQTNTEQKKLIIL